MRHLSYKGEAYRGWGLEARGSKRQRHTGTALTTFNAKHAEHAESDINDADEAGLQACHGGGRRPMSDDFDARKAPELVGTHVLVGITRVDHAGKAIEQTQFHGRVVRATAALSSLRSLYVQLEKSS
jgi:hypothetical protein